MYYRIHILNYIGIDTPAAIKIYPFNVKKKMEKRASMYLII